MSHEPGHVPIDDFTLATESVRLIYDAFLSFVDDMNRGKVDMRIVSHKTTGLIRTAGDKRKELFRRIEIARAQMMKAEGEHH